MDPKYIDAYNNMGMSLFLDNDYHGAIFYLENACSLPDASVAYRSNLAFVYGLTGQISKARAIYSQDFEDNEVEKKIMQLEDLIARKTDK